MKSRILVVDDELSMRDFLAILLDREGYEVRKAESAEQAQALLADEAFDLVLSDVKMPGFDGLSLLRHIKEASPDTAVMMITAYSTAEQAVEAMKLGAYDYIPKPFKVDEVKLLVKNALENRDLRLENIRLKTEITQKYSFSGIIGKNRKMRDLYSLIEKVSGSMANILILGESGTGKELAAKAIHYNSPRKGRPFIAVNCGAIPDTLIESELFGHKKGSFTGAVAEKRGLFEEAEGGTLFLDEIGEIPLLLQAKLLRVLQEREYRKVGGSEACRADVRVISASNRNLEEQVRQGAFREDLYYRLNVISLHMPALRERPEDIPLLIDHFIKKFTGDTAAEVTPEAMKIIMAYPFPGNVRELENLVERCLVLGGSRISETCLPSQVMDFRMMAFPNSGIDLPEDGMNLEAYLDSIEKQLLLQALERCGNIKKKAAEFLGLTFRSFRYRLAKFGMDEE